MFSAILIVFFVSQMILNQFLVIVQRLSLVSLKYNIIFMLFKDIKLNDFQFRTNYFQGCTTMAENFGKIVSFNFFDCFRVFDFAALSIFFKYQ